MKHRIVYLLLKYVLNPSIKLLFAPGIALPVTSVTYVEILPELTNVGLRYTCRTRDRGCR